MIVQDRGNNVSLMLAILVMLVPSAVVLDPLEDGDAIWGDWQLTLDDGARQSEAILSFSEDDTGKLIGQWISVSGVSSLSDLEYADTHLTFKRTDPIGDSVSVSSFTGIIEKGNLSGALSSGRKRIKVSGTWIRPLPRIVGTWDGQIRSGDRESPASLILFIDPTNTLAAEWKAATGEYSISNIAFVSPKLTFSWKGKFSDRTIESAFQGFIKSDTLSGTFKGSGGPSSFQAKHRGSGAIGRWLVRYSDSGPRTQILSIYPDLTGRLGPCPVESLVFEGDNISFRSVAEFGGQTGPVSFVGRVGGKKLSGELTASGQTHKIDGDRIPLPPQTNLAAWAKMFSGRQLDVPYVPTPQPVVDRMLEMAAVTKDDRVYDLGCGDGRIVVTAARKYGCRGVGYDISPDSVRESRANVEDNKVGHLVTIEEKNIFELDLSKASVIILYLLPELNARLIPQLEKLKPGSRIVSHDFDMPGVIPDKVVRIEDKNHSHGGHTIYLWTTPLKKLPPNSDSTTPKDQ